MIERIEKNEKRLDRIQKVIKKFDKALSEFESIEDDIIKLSKYYGSKEYKKDLDAYDNGEITNIKAGVLSEDGVWNTLDEIDDLIDRMRNINVYDIKR